MTIHPSLFDDDDHPFVNKKPELSKLTLSNPEFWQSITGNVPSKSNCYRIIILKNKDKSKQHGSLAKTQELRDYEKSFAYQCTGYKNKNIDVPFKIEANVYYDSRRPDLDNSLKVVLDCLQSVGAIKNDNLCDEIHVKKMKVDKQNPRIEFRLSVL